VLLMLSHSWMQRANTAQRQVAVEGSAGNAKAVAPPAELLRKVATGGNDGAAHDVAVPVQVFRRRMEDDVRPLANRLLQRRGQERVVDSERGAAAFRQFGKARNVDD